MRLVTSVAAGALAFLPVTASAQYRGQPQADVLAGATEAEAKGVIMKTVTEMLLQAESTKKVIVSVGKIYDKPYGELNCGMALYDGKPGFFVVMSTTEDEKHRVYNDTTVAVLDQFECASPNGRSYP